MPTLGRYIVYVTNQNQYEEINRASVHTLSLGGMIHDVSARVVILYRSMRDCIFLWKVAEFHSASIRR